MILRIMAQAVEGSRETLAVVEQESHEPGFLHGRTQEANIETQF